ncbi:RlpA-like double-psi beta-barrel-protein domain-containing protein-containing protein [Rhodotorula toruloides]
MGQVSQYCGRELTITNTANGKSVVATVADACPGCSSRFSLDLSLGAFEAIGDLDTGVLPIVWSWNS